MPELALSTAYFTLQHPEPSGDSIAHQAADLGFRALELDYRITESQLRRLRPFLTRGEIDPVSVHHPFPRRPEVPPQSAHSGGPLLTSLDREERREAVRVGIETLIRASDLGVGVVVLHVGRVTLPADVDSRELERLVGEGKGDAPEYETLKSQLVEAREARARAHLDATLSSLDRLGNEALKQGVRLGLENRYHAEEIPDQHEFRAIFQTLEGAPLGYWHDTGHAASLAAQGFHASPTEVLEALRERVIGFHLHDAKRLDDHMAPGEGELDFSAVAPFATDDTLLVLEVHPKSPPEALERARRLLVEAGFRIDQPSGEAEYP